MRYKRHFPAIKCNAVYEQYLCLCFMHDVLLHEGVGWSIIADI